MANTVGHFLEIRMKTLFILSILFLGSEMQTAHAIRNGRAAPRGKFASVGFINPACTGTLINENTVITANHCLMGSNTLKYNSFVLAINGVEKTFKTVQFKVLHQPKSRIGPPQN